MDIIYPWKMVGQYADGAEIEVGGKDEDECMYKLLSLKQKHGSLEWYSGVCDDEYNEGEYIGDEGSWDQDF